MKLHETACPDCKVVGSLALKSYLYGKPIGTWSLAGGQTKFVGEWKPTLVCQVKACGFTRVGRYDGDSHAVFDAA